MAGHDEFAMDFVADDAHVVALADVGHALQLVARPDASGRVVGVAEQEDGGLLVGTLRLEVVPVNGVGEETPTPSLPSVANEGFAPLCGAAATPVAALKAPVARGEGSLISFCGYVLMRKGIQTTLPLGGVGGGCLGGGCLGGGSLCLYRHEFAFQDLAAVVADGGEEAVVDGCEDEHALAGHGDGLDDGRDGGHDARGVLYPLAADVPLVATLVPPDDGVVVAGLHNGIAEDAVVDALAQRLADGGCCLEVHVGDPEGD